MIVPRCMKCGLNPLLPVKLENAKRLIKALQKQIDETTVLIAERDRLAAENAELIAALDHYAMPLSTR